MFAPAPLFLFKPPASYGPFEWIEAKGADRYRRALYTFRRRSTPYPALTVFDVADRRGVVREADADEHAAAGADGAERDGLRGVRPRARQAGGPRRRQDRRRAARRSRSGCASPARRRPTNSPCCSELLEKHRKRFAAGEANAAEVATGEKEPKAEPPAGLTFADWAAYTLVARVLLNLDETSPRSDPDVAAFDLLRIARDSSAPGRIRVAAGRRTSRSAAAATDDGFDRRSSTARTSTGWVNVNCHPGTFFVKDGEIVTTGTPTGFLRTEKQYENFVLDFDWMHVEKEKMANSRPVRLGRPAAGGRHAVHPRHRGAGAHQLRARRTAGRPATATSSASTGRRARRTARTRKGMERCLPSENRVKGGGEWNHYKVIANDGAIKLRGQRQGSVGREQVHAAEGLPRARERGGGVPLQEHQIKELPSTNPKPEEVAKVWEGHVSIFNGLDLKGWKTEKDAWKAGGGQLRRDGQGRPGQREEVRRSAN